MSPSLVRVTSGMSWPAAWPGLRLSPPSRKWQEVPDPRAAVLLLQGAQELVLRGRGPEDFCQEQGKTLASGQLRVCGATGVGCSAGQKLWGIVRTGLSGLSGLQLGS